MLVGWGATQRQWAGVIVGMPAILGVYGIIIWSGFGPGQVLFRRNLDKEEPSASDVRRG